MKFVSQALALTFFASYASAQGNGLTVNTQQGPVTGTFVVPTVRQFLGIPYAQASRWEAPTATPRRTKTFKASSFGASCIQTLSPPNLEFLHLAGAGGIDVTEAEECLTINVWSPSVERKQSTAVLLWIYGGGFVFGTVSFILVTPTRFQADLSSEQYLNIYRAELCS